MVSGLPAIKIPDKDAPLVEDPFGESLWLDPMTVGLAKQRIRKRITIGDRGKRKDWPLVVVSPGSVWAGSDGAAIFLSAAQFVAKNCEFKDLIFDADLSSQYFFVASRFDDCQFKRGGIWWAGLHSARFYLEDCLIEDRFAKGMSVGDWGLRAERCVFSGVDFPGMDYGKHQPGGFVKERWFRINRCRFVKCEVPASLLFMTRNCVFENCKFIEGDKPFKTVTKPLEVVIYTSDCKSVYRELPEILKLVEKPVSDLPEDAPPTAEELEAMIRR